MCVCLLEFTRTVCADAYGGRRGSDCLELELQTVVSRLIWALGTLLAAEPPPHPIPFLSSFSSSASPFQYWALDPGLSHVRQQSGLELVISPSGVWDQKSVPHLLMACFLAGL